MFATAEKSENTKRASSKEDEHKVLVSTMAQSSVKTPYSLERGAGENMALETTPRSQRQRKARRPRREPKEYGLTVRYGIFM